MMDVEQVRLQAEQEFAAEQRREMVEREKVALYRKQGTPWWRKLFPWKIKIERYDVMTSGEPLQNKIDRHVRALRSCGVHVEQRHEFSGGFYVGALRGPKR
jgi:hypothetical protein